jgi:V/A-type H+-transporting ATPase subunit A
MELDVRNEIIRAKSVVPNDNMEDLTAIQNHLEQQMGELERVYRKDAAV